MVSARTMLSYAFVDGFAARAGVGRAGQNQVLAHLKAAVAAANGVIVDCGFFVTAVRLSVELEAGALGRLRAALERVGVHLFDRCARALDRAAVPESASGLVVAMLHVELATDADVALAASHP